MKPRYLDIKDIPSPMMGRPGTYPFAEWAKIPPGKGLEITHWLDGRPPKAVVTNVGWYRRTHGGTLRAVSRQGRVWIVNEAQP